MKTLKTLGIVFLLMGLYSCSSLKKTMVASALVGGTIGGIGGAIFSPNKESVSGNAFIFSLVGAGLGMVGGYLLHDDPEDQKLQKTMILDEEKKINQKEVPLFDFSPELKGIKPEVNFKPVKKYEVPTEKLPPELNGKVKKQYVLEYESPSQTLRVGNKTIEISPFKAWEHVYED